MPPKKGTGNRIIVLLLLGSNRQKESIARFIAGFLNMQERLDTIMGKTNFIKSGSRQTG